MDIQVTSVSKNKWRMRAERQHQGHSASGEAVVIQSTAPTGDAPHAALAGARAWLALGRARQTANDNEGAITCAWAGLAELGPDYNSPDLGIKDDTRLHVDLAEDLLENGRQPEAVRRLLQALGDRLDMYVNWHADTLVTG